MEKTKTSARRNARDAKKSMKNAKKIILDDITTRMFDSKKENNGRIPHKFVDDIVNTMAPSFPWLKRNTINYHFKNVWMKAKLLEDP